MAYTWYSITKQIPDDGDYVWVKTIFQNCEPVKGIYNSATQMVVTLVIHANIPLYSVYKWRYV